ncbi:MAG: ribosome silencing factor [Myxococcota bacterium]
MEHAVIEEELTIDTQQLTQHIVACLLDKKARDISVLNVEGRTSYCDRLVLCTGTSSRQVRALAEHVAQAMKSDHGRRPLGREGTEAGRWVLVDFGDVVVHIFDTQSRDHYDLDGLWVDAPRVTLSALGFSEEVPSAEMAPFV